MTTFVVIALNLTAFVMRTMSTVATLEIKNHMLSKVEIVAVLKFILI